MDGNAEDVEMISIMYSKMRIYIYIYIYIYQNLNDYDQIQ